jgi:hypothetical protein
MIEMEAHIVAARVMPYPPAVRMHMRRAGMAFHIVEIPLRRLAIALLMLLRASRRRARGLGTARRNVSMANLSAATLLTLLLRL